MSDNIEDRPTLPETEPPPPQWATALLGEVAALHGKLDQLVTRQDFTAKAVSDVGEELQAMRRSYDDAIERLGTRVRVTERSITPPPMAAVRLPGTGAGNGGQ